MRTLQLLALVLLLLAACGEDDTPETEPIAKGESCLPYGSVTLPAPLADAPSTPHIGGLAGTFAVSASGEATYSVPLAVPPGPSQLSVDLGLEYRSGGGDAYVGAGFSISGLSAIARCPKVFARDTVIEPVQYRRDDDFCLDGHRLWQIQLLGFDVEYRTIPDSFVKVIAHYDSVLGDDPSSFTVMTRAGSRIEYGTTTQSKVTAKRGGDYVTGAWLVSHMWAPATVATVDYDYINVKDPADPYTREVAPASISYGTRRVWFIYGSKDPADIRPTFARGLRLDRTLRLDRILTSPNLGETTAREYRFAYTAGPHTGRTLLASVQQCEPAGCQPATTFEYGATPASEAALWNVQATGVAPPIAHRATAMVMDVTGDGLDDLVRSDVAPTMQTRFTVERNLGNGTFAAPQTAYEQQIFGDPPGNPADTEVDRGIALDYDQDGLQDLLLADVQGHFANWQVLMTHRDAANNVTFDRVDTGIPRPFHAGEEFPAMTLQNVYGSFHLADLDGDGGTDLIECESPDHGQTFDWTVHYWRTAPWQPAPGFDAHGSVLEGDHVSFTSTPCDVPMYTVDVDHDGRTDLVTREVIAFPDGGFQLGNKWMRVGVFADLGFEIADLSLPFDDTTLTFADLNGDGLPDAIRAPITATNNLMVSFNTGGAFAPSIPALANPPQVAISANLGLAAPIDVDGDGRQDVIVPIKGTGQFPQWMLLHATPSLTAPVVLQSSGITSSLDFPFDQEPRLDFVLAPRVADLDGNGTDDVLLLAHDKLEVFRSVLGEEDALTGITSGTNAWHPGDPKFVRDVAISYTHLIDSAITDGIDPGSTAADPRPYLSRLDPASPCAYPRRCVVGGRRVVGSYAVNDGADHARWYDLRYRDARFEKRGLGWLGFGRRLTTDRDTGITTQETYDNRQADPLWNDYPRAFLPEEVRTWTPAKPTDPDPGRVDLRVETTTRETQFDSTPGPLDYFTVPTKQVVATYQGHVAPGKTLEQWARTAESDGATLVSQQRETIQYDAFGNPLSNVRWTPGTDIVTWTTRTVDNDVAGWQIGRTTHQETCGDGGGVERCRITDLTYDANGLVHTRAIAGNDTASTLAFTYGYDAYANPVAISAVDDKGHARSACVTFEPTGTYPWAMVDGVGHKTFTDFDPRDGNLRTLLDPNGHATRWAYDLFGRMTSEQRADGTSSTIARSTVADPVRGTQIQIATAMTGEPTQTVQIDALGREVMRLGDNVQPYCTGTCLIMPRLATYTDYDPATGYIARESVATSELTPYASVAYWYTYTYDAAGRRIETRPPWASGLQKFRYDLLTTTIDGPGAVTKTEVRDQRGRLRSVTDPGGTTAYDYEAFDQLAHVTGPDGTVSTYEHDALGRTTRSVTPDRGATTYVFDGFGDVLTQTDAAARTSTYDYDAIGRLIQRNDADGTTAVAWDSAANGTGMLASVTLTPPAGAPIVRSHVYDTNSRLTSESLLLAGETLTTSYGYDSASRLATVTYPAAAGISGTFQIKREYDGTGHLKRVANAATNATYWALTKADVAGHPVDETFGNGVVTTRTWAQDKDRVTGITSKLGTTTLQDLTYEWSDRLQLLKRSDLLGGQAETFGYDLLDRLTCTTLGTGPCTVSIAYTSDGSGNIRTKSDVGTYAYDPAHPHAVSAAGASTFSYDLVGNQIARPGATLSYTATDLVHTIQPATKGAAAITYDYDGAHDRVRRTAGTEVTVYDGLYERVTKPSSVLHYYSIANDERVVAMVTRRVGSSDHTLYVHPDHLGSPDVLTTAAGAVADRRSFDAFGKRRGAVWTQHYSGGASAEPLGYTGQYEDALGLVDMRSRTYDPTTARFLQADRVVPLPKFSQSWNPYSYVYNDPLVYVDPSGHTANITHPPPPLPPPQQVPGPTQGTAFQKPPPPPPSAPTAPPEAQGDSHADNQSTGRTSEFTANNFDVGSGDMDLWESGSCKGDPCFGEPLDAPEERETEEPDLDPVPRPAPNPSRPLPGFYFPVTAGLMIGALIAVGGTAGGQLAAELGLVAVAVGETATELELAAEAAEALGEEAGLDSMIDRAMELRDARERLLEETARQFEQKLQEELSGEQLEQLDRIMDQVEPFSVTDPIPDTLPDGQPELWRPSARGRPPTGIDGYSIELHHGDQTPDGVLHEMTRTEHRLGPNYARNHGNTGGQPSLIDRLLFKRLERRYWAWRWDNGLKDLPKKP